MNKKLSNGAYLLVFHFPSWTPEWALEKMMTLNKEFKILKKKIKIEGIYACRDDGVLNMKLTLSENPWPVVLLYTTLIIVTGVAAWFALKKIYRIIELPFKHPVVGLALITVVGLIAARGLKK